MRIEVNAPCSLALGAACLEQAGHSHTLLLGITLQHPPVHLRAEPAAALQATGARADLAYAQAQRLLAAEPGLAPANLEIELAIPRFMGLGSDAMLGLSVARALRALQSQAADLVAAARRLGLGPASALEVHGFQQGGVLAVSATDLVQAPFLRHALAQPDERAWAFVLHLPHRPRDAAPDLEANRRARLLQAAERVRPETGRLLTDELWPALEADDLDRFASGLARLQGLNRAAFQEGGLWEPPSLETQGVLDVLKQNGAVAVGESLTGLARWGLVRGARPSIDLRTALTRHVGLEGGTVMASICARAGAVQTQVQPASAP